MIKANYSEIKRAAKNRMDGNFGEAFVALALIPFVYGIGQAILNMILSSLPLISSITQFLLTILFQYLVIIAALKFAKGKYSDLFTNMFGNGKTYLKFILLSLLLTVLYFLPLLIYIDFFTQLTSYIDSTPVTLLFATQTPGELIKSFLPSTEWIILSFALLLGILAIQVKLLFVTYIFVDEDISLIESIKRSWEYTNGNFFRVFFFPISFFLWVFVGFIVIMIFNAISGPGILSILVLIALFGYVVIYLTPYLQIALAVMYMNFKKENGDPTPITETVATVKTETKYFDPLAEIEEPENKKDPFDKFN